MEEQLISFETAKLAKEKGFAEETAEYFSKDVGDNGTFSDAYNLPNYHNSYGNRFSAPTQSLLQKWLREVHNIDVWATPLLNHECKKYNNTMVNRNIDVYDLLVDDEDYNTYEEALEAGLLEALKLIRNE